jgi:hypothetical protein
MDITEKTLTKRLVSDSVRRKELAIVAYLPKGEWIRRESDNSSKVLLLCCNLRRIFQAKVMGMM